MAIWMFLGKWSFNMNKKDLKSKLSKASYIVTQEHGTEAPFSGELLELEVNI